MKAETFHPLESGHTDNVVCLYDSFCYKLMQCNCFCFLLFRDGRTSNFHTYIFQGKQPNMILNHHLWSNIRKGFNFCNLDSHTDDGVSGTYRCSCFIAERRRQQEAKARAIADEKKMAKRKSQAIRAGFSSPL